MTVLLNGPEGIKQLQQVVSEISEDISGVFVLDKQTGHWFKVRCTKAEVLPAIGLIIRQSQAFPQWVEIEDEEIKLGIMFKGEYFQPSTEYRYRNHAMSRIISYNEDEYEDEE